MQLRFLLLAALVGTCLASAGHGVKHLTDADFAEQTGDGKVRLAAPIGPITWVPPARLLRNRGPAAAPSKIWGACPCRGTDAGVPGRWLWRGPASPGGGGAQQAHSPQTHPALLLAPTLLPACRFTSSR